MTNAMMIVAFLINIILLAGIAIFFRSEKKKMQELKKSMEQMEISIQREICANFGVDLQTNPSATLSAKFLQTNGKVINSGPDYCAEGFEYDLSSFEKETYNASFLMTDGKE